MNGLTQGRVTRSEDWRNSARKLRNASAGSGAHREADPASSAVTHFAAPEALGRTVEREVIPRLMVVHRPHRISTLHSRNTGHVEPADVVEFSALIATRDIAEALARIELKRAQGMPLEALYLNLLIPAARHLSDLWEADLCHYEEIAVGMLHLHQVLHELSPVFSTEGECRSCNRRALLLSAPAEQNMLGVFMVTDFYRCVASEFFYRAGWEVWRAPPSSRSSLIDILSSQWFDVVDISASCEARLPQLSADLAQMRKASRNARVGMSVGGPVFNDHPEFASRVGADASASDPRDTLAQAEMLVALRER